MIVVGDKIFFSTATWNPGGSPFIASIDINGENLKYYYILDQRYLDDENRIIILGAGERYLHCEVSTSVSFKFVIDTYHSKLFRVSGRLDYKKILNKYPDDNITEKEIREEFENRVEYIDCSNEWVYLDNYNKNGYSYLKIKLNGSQLQQTWYKADWSVFNTHNIKTPCIEKRYFNGKIDIFIAHGALYRRYPNGKVVKLGGMVEIPDKYVLHVSGDFAYWGSQNPRRININTGVEEEIDLNNLILKKI